MCLLALTHLTQIITPHCHKVFMKTTMHLDILYNLEILGFFFLTLT